MKIYFCVKEFGKIRSARINISNFTVFIGENNSGKTKLMELIYGVLSWLSKYCPNIGTKFVDNKFSVSKDEIRKLIASVNQELKQEKQKIVQEIFNRNIPVEEISLEIEDIDCWYEIIYVDESNLAEVYEKELISESEMRYALSEESSLYFIIGIKHSSKDERIMERWKTRVRKKIPKGFMNQIGMGEILANLLGMGTGLIEELLFLPASRMGLMLLYKDYFGKNYEDKEQILKDNHNANISQPMRDFLYFLLKYSYNELQAEKNSELIKFIEDNLINGKLDESSEVTTYKPKDSDVEVPLYLSSSMINELDPIVKMLTSFKRTKMLFYDEVETSMHPLKQLELVKLLNRLNNAGIRIIMSTHSETFVTKFNNLLLISFSHILNGKDLSICKDKIKITAEDLLTSEDVNVYQFVNKEDGTSEIEELEFRKTPYVGYTFEMFEDSASALYEESKIALGIEKC